MHGLHLRWGPVSHATSAAADELAAIAASLAARVSQLSGRTLSARKVEEHLLQGRLTDGVILNEELLLDRLHRSEDFRPRQIRLVHLVLNLNEGEPITLSL